MTAYGDLMDEDAPDPAAMLADKGYDSDAIRSDLEDRGIEPVIPTKSNRKVQRPVCRQTYAHRNRIVSAVLAAPFARGHRGRCSEPLRASTYDDFRVYA